MIIRHDDWYRLIGATVEIRRKGDLVRTGRVEHATRDSNILWLAQEGNNPRRMIDKAQGYEAWDVAALPADPGESSPA